MAFLWYSIAARTVIHTQHVATCRRKFFKPSSCLWMHPLHAAKYDRVIPHGAHRQFIALHRPDSQHVLID
jgi:hypothetical protein